MKRAIVMVLLVVLGAAGGHALAEAIKNPLDEPLVMTKGEWIEAICILSSDETATYSFKAENNRVVVTPAAWFNEGKGLPIGGRPVIVEKRIRPKCDRLLSIIRKVSPAAEATMPE